MSDELPEDLPPTEQRKDVNTRKVIEVLKKHFDKTLDEKLKGHVTYAALAGSIVGVLGLVILLATAIASPAKERSVAAEAKTDKLEGRLEKLTDTINDLKISAAEARATYRVVVEGLPKAKAKAEAEQRKTEER